MKQSESYYQEHAQLICSECGGRGVLWIFPSQDHASLVPCSKCFEPGSEITSFNEPEPKPIQLLLSKKYETKPYPSLSKKTSPKK